MTEEEENAIRHFVVSVALVCGDLACTISEDPEWPAVSAKTTRDHLMKALDELMKQLGWDKKP